MSYQFALTKRAQKDALKIEHAGLQIKVEKLLDLMMRNPFENPPPYEKLTGDLSGMYSRRINIQHRLVYAVLESKKTIKILSLWTHYE